MFTTPTSSPTKKRLRFASGAPLGESPRAPGAVNWANCCLCGEAAGRPGLLKCPARNPVASQRHAGYKTLAGMLREFQGHGLLPRHINLKALQGDAESLEASFINNKAQWHTVCGLKYNRQALTRLLSNSPSDKENRTIKKEPSTPTPSTPLSGKRTRTPKTPDSVPLACLFCGDGPTWNARLLQLSTPHVEEQILNIGRNHPNPLIRGAISGLAAQGSLLKKDAKIRYHLKCYSMCLFEAEKKQESSGPGWQICEAITFSEIVNHIKYETARLSGNVVFKMSVLSKMYNDRLGLLLGVDPKSLKPIHTTRLRERILLKVTDLEPKLEGKEYCLVPSNAAFLHTVMEEDMDENGIVFDRFVKLMRKELENSTCHFTGNFNQKCQEESVPPALLAMCSKMLYGSQPQTFNRSTKPAISLAQLFLFNYKKYRRRDSTELRQMKVREPPLPVFVGLSTWGRTRMRKVVDTSHSLGLSVSSYRVREITSALCQWVVDRANNDRAVIPANLVVGVFTALCYDNVDWNPTSNTSVDSFHGTAMSVLQMPSTASRGVPVPLIPPSPDFTSSSTKVPELPNFYSEVPADMLPSDKPLHSLLRSESKAEEMISKRTFMECWKLEKKWLNHVDENYKTAVQSALNFSWSGYHASQQTEDENVVPGINSLLPIFYEDSDSVAMVAHGMRITKSTVQRVNTGQTPVLCCDQPLFATGKLIQWSQSEFSEEKMFLVFGQFHIEQNFSKLLGHILEGSGLVPVVASSDLFTEQAVQSLLAVNSVKKSRAMHHVLASVLFILLREAYQEENSALSFDEWLKQRSSESDLFYFWFLILNLQVLLFRFVWALRTRNFPEFCETLKAMLPWYFAMDRHNYARWLSIHVKDLLELPVVSPDVHEEFQRGNFSFPISTAKFSCVGLDQIHEQNNKVVKGDGGAVGLAHDPDALRRWSIAGPEVQRLLEDFEGTSEADSKLHHEQYPAFQENCRQQIEAVKKSFLSFRNPFLDSPRELLVLDSLVVVGGDGSAALRKLEAAGRDQYQAFIQDRLSSRKIGLFQPIKRNNFRVFTAPKKRVDGRLVSIKALEADVELFSRLYMMAGSNGLDYREFFRYENQACPPSLSKDGSLYPHEKSELVPVLEKLRPASCSPNVRADTLIFDGAALVHMLRPRQEKTFSDYWPKTLQVYVNQLQERYGASRVDLVWDLYYPHSIKTATRESRGVGVRRKVLATTQIPTKSWSDFLQNDENKAQLFRLLAYDATKGQNNELLVTNIGDTVVSSHDPTNAGTSLSGVSCGEMEEADSRIILHLKDAVAHGSKSAVIRSVDTDVLVLAISYYPMLSVLGLQDLWVHFGTGKNQKLIDCHSISTALGREKSTALRGFHAFSGCDYTSGFRGKRKASMFSAWISFPEATEAFLYLSEPVTLQEFNEDIFKILDNFVIHLYGADFPGDTLDEHRMLLYTKKCTKLQNLPPTSNTLLCHVLRCAFVAGQMWGQAWKEKPTLPSPAGWGWTKNSGKFEIEWSKLAPIWEIVRKILSTCGCTTGCTGKRCRCWINKTNCTIFCKCIGCHNEKPTVPADPVNFQSDDQDPDDPAPRTN